VAVPLFGIQEQGLGGYLKSYMQPTFIMLPFNLISEVSRTLALAVRLFGNMMSGAMIIGILLTITPFMFPIVMTLLGLLTGWCRLTSSAFSQRSTSRPPRRCINPNSHRSERTTQR
jgi:F0F1-type ATP synthase membrane subunit a